MPNPLNPSCAALAAALALLAACQVPRAKLHNLREVHATSGNLSYRGDVQSDLEFILTRSLGQAPVSIGLDSFGNGDEIIEDPLVIDLDNLVDLGRMDADDPLTRGIRVEAFGWLAVDDQYVLGRERAVLELGKHLIYEDMSGFVTPPEEPVGPEQLSPVLADLARAALGSLPESLALQDDPEQEGPPSLDEAIAAVRDLELDRQGALRGLALVDILFQRSDALLAGDAGTELRALAAELRREITGQALFEAARDEDPLVRAACATAMTRLPDGLPPRVLRGFLADPDAEVAVIALKQVAERGLPLGDDPLMQATELDEWIETLMAYAQFPEGRRSAFACAALSAVADAGFASMRSEDWATWWRETRPEQPMPSFGG